MGGLTECPNCGNPTVEIYGDMWDCDRIICTAYGCDWEQELGRSTCNDGYVIDLSEEE